MSAHSLFLRFWKWRPVHCLRYNRVHPVFLLMPWGTVNCSFLLCGQSVQFMDSVYTVFLKVNVRRSPDNGSKYHCLVWCYSVDVCLFSPSEKTTVLFLQLLGGRIEEVTGVCRHTVCILSCTGNGVTRYFHGINMTGLLKRQNIAWDYMYT